MDENKYGALYEKEMQRNADLIAKITELEERLEKLDSDYNEYIAANEPADDDPERGRFGR